MALEFSKKAAYLSMDLTFITLKVVKDELNTQTGQTTNSSQHSDIKK
jgi:hypothetical protein